jgi:hypothetical protein
MKYLKVFEEYSRIGEYEASKIKQYIYQLDRNSGSDDEIIEYFNYLSNLSEILTNDRSRLFYFLHPVVDLGKIDILNQIKDQIVGILSQREKDLLKSIAKNSLKKTGTRTRINDDGGVEYVDHDRDLDTQLTRELHEIIDDI